jgi:hypothetical protein
MKLIIIFLFFGVSAFAGEVDNFSRRYDPIGDSRDVLNQQVNKILNDAVKRMNHESSICAPEFATEVVQKAFGYEVNNVQSFAEESAKVDKHVADKNNIYATRSLSDKMRGTFLSNSGLDVSLNIDGHYVGSDKLTEFFNNGLDLYDMYTNKKWSLPGALKYHVGMKGSTEGLDNTQVQSYADVSAAYSGFKFWRALLGNDPDGEKPYLICEGDHWKLARPFDFSEYVDDSWDEGINCSVLKTGTEGAVHAQIAKLEEASHVVNKSLRYRCPISANRCVALKKQFADIAPQLLGPDCLNAQPNAEDRAAISGQIRGYKSNWALPAAPKAKKAL